MNNTKQQLQQFIREHKKYFIIGGGTVILFLLVILILAERLPESLRNPITSQSKQMTSGNEQLVKESNQNKQELNTCLQREKDGSSCPDADRVAELEERLWQYQYINNFVNRCPDKTTFPDWHVDCIEHFRFQIPGRTSHGFSVRLLSRCVPQGPSANCEDENGDNSLGDFTIRLTSVDVILTNEEKGNFIDQYLQNTTTDKCRVGGASIRRNCDLFPIQYSSPGYRQDNVVTGTGYEEYEISYFSQDDVSFEKNLIFYTRNKKHILSVSADRERMMKENPEFFRILGDYEYAPLIWKDEYLNGKNIEFTLDPSKPYTTDWLNLIGSIKQTLTFIN